MFSKGKRLIFLALCYIVISGLVIPATLVWGRETEQTIPTRTPVPQPTNTPRTGGGGSNNPPAATAVPNTPRPTVTPSAVPLNINLEPCGVPSFVADLGIVNVRSGPGVDYPVIGQLAFTETVVISGRAAFAPWWQIELENDTKGWVADRTGGVYGYTAAVKIIPIPDLESGTPTPGPAWNPTPDPMCPTLTPTPTRPTATPTKTATSTATRRSANRSSTAASEETAALITTTPSPTIEVTSDTMVTAAAVLTKTAAEIVTNETTAAVNTSAEGTNSSGRSISGFLIIGFGLIILGLVVAGIRRAQR